MGRGALVLLLGLVLHLAGSASALYDPNGPVALLGSRSFGAVTRSKVPVVVEFFAPWCGHCKALAPAFSKAAAKLEGIVPFAAVDCDQEANRPLCGQYGVQGFPTIKLFSPGAKGPSVRDYQAERTAKALADAALGMLTAKHVQRIKSAADATEFAAKAGPKVLLVSDKSDTPAALKSLSQRFAPAGVAFAQLQARDPAAAAELMAALGGGVERLPALLLLGADGSRSQYEGETKPPLLLKWLQRLVGGGKAAAGDGGPGAAKRGTGAEAEAAEQAAGETEGRKKEVPAELPQVVANATVAELSRRLQQQAVLLLSFYAGSESACREHLNKLNAAAAGLQGLVSGVQVDLGQASEAAAAADLFSVTLPEAGQGGCAAQTFLLPFDAEDHEDADEWRPWQGELVARELHKAALELFPAGSVPRVTADTYQQLMAASGADRVKVLLFSDKEEPPAVFRALSANFRPYKMDFGFVHSGEAQLMEQFNVAKVPHLVALFADPRAAKAGGDSGEGQQGGQVRLAIQPYLGPIKYGSIAGWLTVLGLQTGTAPEEALRQFGGGGASRDAMVARVTSPESWEASCLSHAGVCLVAALSLDAAQQAAQLEVLHAAAAGRGDQPLRFSWFEFDPARAGTGSGAAAAFAEELGLGGGAPPALVALAPRKQRSAVMTARFEPDAIRDWLDGLLAGRVRTSPLHRLPAFPAADGSDAAAAAEAAAEVVAAADEFDLSDIMQEEIEGDLSKGRKDEL